MSTNSIWSKGFILACIGCFLLFTNFYMFLAAIPLAIQQMMNGTAKDMSLVVSIYILGITLLRPFSGVIADKFGKKRVSIITLIGFVICSFLYLGVSAIFPLLMVRIIHGIIHSSSTTAHAAMAIDMLPVDKKGEGIGYYGLSMSLSMVLGPALGIFLLNSFDYQMLIIVGAVFSSISLVATIFIKEAVPIATVTEEAFSKKMTLSDFIEPKAIPVCIAALVFSFSYSSLISFLPVYTKSIGIAEAGMYFFISFAISIMVTRPAVGKLLDKKGPSFLLFPALVIFSFGAILLSFSVASWMIIVVGLIMGVAYGAIFPSFQTITVRLSSSGRTGVATATFFLFWDIGFGLGAFVLAMVSAILGYSGMYQIVSILAIATLGLYYVLHHKRVS